MFLGKVYNKFSDEMIKDEPEPTFKRSNTIHHFYGMLGLTVSIQKTRFCIYYVQYFMYNFIFDRNHENVRRSRMLNFYGKDIFGVMQYVYRNKGYL